MSTDAELGGAHDGDRRAHAARTELTPEMVDGLVGVVLDDVVTPAVDPMVTQRE